MRNMIRAPARGVSAPETLLETMALLPEAEGSAPLPARCHAPRWRAVRGFGMSLAAAGAAAALIAGVLALAGSSGNTSSRSASQGQFLSEKDVLIAAAGGGSSVEATAQQLSQAADAANAKLQADREEVKRLQKQADEIDATGKDEVKGGADKLKAAEEAEAKAQALQKKADEEARKAQEMLAEAKKREQDAKDLRGRGAQAINDAKGLRSQAETIESGEGQEAATAAAAIKQELPALEEEAKFFADEAKAKKVETDAAIKAATEKLDSLSAAVDKVDGQIEDTKKKLKDAQDRKQKATDADNKAKAAEAAATGDSNTETDNEKQGRQDLAAGKDAAAAAKQQQGEVDMESAGVVKLEKQATAKAAAHRVCVDLPGARLRETDGASDFAPVAMDRDTSSAKKCAEWCRQHEGCAQAIFSAGNKGCYLFEKTTREVHEWDEVYTSSVCGDKSQEKDLKALVNDVNSAKPDVPSIVPCSWTGEDCGSTKCCNEVSCSWDFKTCKGFS